MRVSTTLAACVLAATAAAADVPLAVSAKTRPHVAAAIPLRAPTVAPPPGPPSGPTTGAAIVSVSRSPASGAIPRFGHLELTVVLDRTIERPYEADPVQGGLDLWVDFTSPSGASWRVNGFWDGAAWKVRFTPDEVDGATHWTYVANARSTGGTATTSGSFSCSGLAGGAARRGWLRVDGGGLRFSGDGGWFYGLGHNTGWQSQVEIPSLATMHASGENVLSFWCAEPWVRAIADGSGQTVLPERAPLETAAVGLGQYNQTACTYLDGVVARAEAQGVYLLPSLWAHDEVRDAFSPWGASSWDNNAYQTVCTDSRDFFKTAAAGGGDTVSWHWQKNRYRYIAARWGSSTAILGWVGLVEIDGTAGAAMPEGPTWCAAVRQELYDDDPFRRGPSSSYPFVVTKTDSASVDAATWGSFMDLEACDSYLSMGDDYAVAKTIADETATMRALGHPCLHTEFGGDVLGGATQPAHLRAGLLGGLGSGDSLAPLLWTDGGDFPLCDSTVSGTALLGQFLACSRFAAALSDLGDPSLVDAAPTFGDAALRGWGLRRATAADWGFVCIQANAPISSLTGSETVVVGNLAPSTYQAVWYDPSGGTVVATQSVAAVGAAAPAVLTLTLPSVSGREVCVRFTSDASAELPFTGTLANPPVIPGSSGGSPSSGSGCGFSGLVGLIGGIGLLTLRRRR